MGIYLHNMEMPTEGEYHMTLYVCSDGSAYIDVASFPVDKDRFDAVPVQKHGKLIDVSDAVSALLRDNDYAAALTVRNCPTIIQASGGSEDE